MSKSHKKLKFNDEYENKTHHTYKKIKNIQAKKQMKKLDRELDRSKNKYWNLEEFA